VDQAIRLYLENPPIYDYVSNAHDSGFPLGLATEVFSFTALETAYREATQPYEREHVTPYIHQHPDRFRLKHLRSDHDLSGNRWTVDTPEDFELIQHILEAIYPNNPQFTMNDVLALLEQHPHWRDINRHIRQKTLKE
jgi:spore coat polysaccharide biosynthesis protein SpsF